MPNTRCLQRKYAKRTCISCYMLFKKLLDICSSSFSHSSWCFTTSSRLSPNIFAIISSYPRPPRSFKRANVWLWFFWAYFSFNRLVGNCFRPSFEGCNTLTITPFLNWHITFCEYEKCVAFGWTQWISYSLLGAVLT